MKVSFVCRVSAVGIVLLAIGSRAHAQSASDKAAAEGLFDQGRAAMQEGDFAKACGLLERSQHIDPGIGTLLYLGECYEKSGRTASAWATFREAADAADRAKETGRARTGRDRAARLEPNLSRLTILVSPEAQQIAGLSIERGGKSVQSALWNVPLPVDPTEYQISASAPGYETWSQTVVVPERAAKVSVTVPALKKAAEADKPPTPPAADATKPSPSPTVSQNLLPPPSPPTADNGGDAQRTAAFIVGGVGVVGVGLGAFFGLRALSKNHDAEDHCPQGYMCNDAEGPALADDARAAAKLSNIAFGVGGAALIGGAVLYFTSQKSSTTAVLGPNGVSIRGSFQ